MSKFKNFIRFFKSKAFLLNLLVGIIVFPVILWLIFSSLDGYVDKEATVTVPDLTGYTVDEMQAVLDEKGLRTKIDYSFNPDLEYGLVMDQDPIPGTTVKFNRRIYIIANTTSPPLTKVNTNAFGSTRRLAEATLLAAGFIVEVKYIPYPDLDKVVNLKHNDRVLQEGDELPYGSKIVMEVGKGNTGERTSIPNLYGLTILAANNILSNASLNMGLIYRCDGCMTAQDTAAATIISQRPGYTATGMIMVGSEIEVGLSLNGGGAPPDSLATSTQ